jgi:hypothetical protein
MARSQISSNPCAITNHNFSREKRRVYVVIAYFQGKTCRRNDVVWHRWLAGPDTAEEEPSAAAAFCAATTASSAGTATAFRADTTAGSPNCATIIRLAQHIGDCAP